MQGTVTTAREPMGTGGDPLGSPPAGSSSTAPQDANAATGWHLIDRVPERAARAPPTQHHQPSQEQMLGRNYFHPLPLLRHHARQEHSSQSQIKYKHRWGEFL